MKKKFVFAFLIYVLASVHFCYGQSFKQDIPVLFGIDGEPVEKNIRIEWGYSEIRDTLNVVTHVMVNFKYPLWNASKPIIINSVQLIGLDIFDQHKNQIASLSNLNNGCDLFEKRLWNYFEKKLLIWYQEQPYEHISIRGKVHPEKSDVTPDERYIQKMYGDSIVWGGVIRLIPSQ